MTAPASPSRGDVEENHDVLKRAIWFVSNSRRHTVQSCKGCRSCQSQLHLISFLQAQVAKRLDIALYISLHCLNRTSQHALLHLNQAPGPEHRHPHQPIRPTQPSPTPTKTHLAFSRLSKYTRQRITCDCPMAEHSPRNNHRHMRRRRCLQLRPWNH